MGPGNNAEARAREPVTQFSATDSGPWVSRLKLKVQIHCIFAPIPQQTQRPLSTFPALGADPEAQAQVAHADLGLGTGQVPDVTFPNSLADADVH
jgi:hypothetical protein